jgi:NAD(P)-dependent dehydrogenase (short-subunit alcohol dehydrogenase family)
MNDENRQFDCAVVQGASRGIGLEFTRALVADPRYRQVVATCRDPQRALALTRLRESNHGRLAILELDVTQEESIKAAAAATADLELPVNLIINSAGILHDHRIGPEKRLADIEPTTIQQVFAINAVGPLLVAKHFSPLFDRRARTVLANLSARVGSIEGNALGGWYSYRASKAAQNMFTRNLSVELKRRHSGIICVALHPGTVDTELSRPFQRNVPEHKLFSVERAAGHLIEVINGLQAHDNGRFYAWNGSEIAW